MNHLQQLKIMLSNTTTPVLLPIQNGQFSFKAIIDHGNILGVEVDNLNETNKFISIDVFVAVISLLKLSPDFKAPKGNAMNFLLGEEGLAFNSVEGHVAHVIYGKQLNDNVFRRITPISRILEWASICENGRGYLMLRH